MTRSDIPKKRITLEIVQGSQLSDADLDFMAKLVARAINRQLESEKSLTPQGGQRCDIDTEPDRS